MTEWMDAARQAAEILGPEVVKVGARRLGRPFLGTPTERGMQDVYTKSIAGCLVEVAQASEAAGSRPDPEAMRVAETVLGGLCADDEAAGLLLNVALRPGPIPFTALRGRAVAVGYEPDTLPFAFDGAMRTLAGKVWEEFLFEAGKDNSRIQPLVNQALLAAVRSLYRMAESKDEGPKYADVGASSPERLGICPEPAPRVLASAGRPRSAPRADPRSGDDGRAVLLVWFAVDAPHGGGVLGPGDHLLDVHAALLSTAARRTLRFGIRQAAQCRSVRR